MHGKAEWATLSRLDLMLHEWESEHEPFPCPPVVFQARQAMKMAVWLQRVIPALTFGNVDIVVQSEHASPQAAAITRVLANSFGWQIIDEIRIAPHEGTQFMLEAAIEAATMSGGSVDSLITEATPSSQTIKLAWLGSLFQILNVQFVALADQPSFAVVDEASCKRAREQLLAQFGLRQLNARDREVLDFIIQVMLLRRTCFSSCLPTLDSEGDPEGICSHSVLIADSTLLSNVVAGTAQRWTIHCFYEPGQIDQGLKSSLLRRGAWLIDSPVGAGRLLSISWRPDPCSEIFHHRLRYPYAR